MTRFVAVCVAVGVSIAGARLARADLPNGATISFSRFSIKKNGSFGEPDIDDRRKFLNLAHCVCAKANAADVSDFRYDLKLSPDIGASATGDIWVGSSCDGDDTTRMTNCLELTDKRIPDVRTLVNTQQLTLNLYDVVNGKDSKDHTAVCKQEEGSKLVYLFVDTSPGLPYEYGISQAVGEATTGDMIKLDTRPPEPVTGVSAAGSEGTVEIKWTPSTSNNTDYYVYQALCANVDDTPVFDSPKGDPEYQTAEDLCGQSGDFELSQTQLDLPGEDRVTTAPAGFSSLDPAFLCGTQMGGTSQSLRIEGLKNGTKYKVALLAIDYHGNVRATYLSSTVTPQPATDFWEDLNERDSAIDGGCLLSTTYGDDNPLTRAMRSFRDGTLARTAYGRWLIDAYYGTLGRLHVHSLPARIAAGILLAPLVALGLLWHLLTLPGLLVLLALPWLWRRRAALLRSRRLRLAAAGAAALVALGYLPRAAHADDLTPYWEDPTTEEAELDVPGEVKWQAGIRLGPYTPDIDLQFGLNALTGKGPYESMFGDYSVNGDKRHRRVWQVLPMLDVDRIVWQGFGQVGVGGSIGYMQKSAYAYADGTTQDQDPRDRSTAARNTFRLLPLAATATYRFTYLDDRWGIPIVPYLRAGLAYYVWWIKAPNGDVAKVCEDGSDTMGCKDDKAYGGTFGIQASAGLAIRAERIDAAAARSMRNSGMQHAGFYGEVFWGRVDGFGSETKLWVGDTTWFAGVNFEF